LPSYQRISDYATSREPLEYTRLGKLRRHVLEGRYDRAKRSAENEMAAGPVAPGKMSEEDRALLEDPVAMGVWELLAERFPDRRLTPEISPQLDLDIDSLGWVNLTLEIGEKTGVELREEAIGRIGIVRDLLREIACGADGRTRRSSPLERPEEFLDDRQKRWLKPLGPAASVVARGMFALNRTIMRGLFRLRVEGLENVPEEGLIHYRAELRQLPGLVRGSSGAPPRRVAAYVLGRVDGCRLRHPLTRLGSRLARVVPVDPDRGGLSSLAFGTAVLGRGQNLVWFAEGERSRTGSLQPFKPGVGMLLEYYPVPVVHVFVRSTYEAMPRGRYLRRLEKVTVSFGEPFDPRSLDEDDGSRKQVVEAVRERVAELGGRRPGQSRRTNDEQAHQQDHRRDSGRSPEQPGCFHALPLIPSNTGHGSPHRA
jgi:long-chain acyl-CoA synthetase